MSACGKCNKVVTSSTKTKLQCAICHVYYHATCANIKESDVDTLSKKPYYCDVCVKKIRLQRSASDSTPVKTDQQSEQLITSDACSVKVFKEMLEQLENKILNGQRRLEDDLAYLQGPAEPFHTNLSRKSSLHHETWLLISAGVCALLLLLILVVLTVLGVSSRTRKRQRIDGSANREQVYRQEQHQRRSKVKVKGHDTSAGQENMAYQHDDNEQGKAVNPDSPGRLSLRSGPSSAASLVRRSAQNAPTPHPRPRPRSRKASPNSFLSMPSVKQFPRGPPVAEPLEQVLQPEIISEHHQRHVDDPGCSEQRGDAATRRHPHPPSDLPLTRHRSQNEGEDPGVIGPLVWDLHCHRMHKQECLEAEEEFEPNVGRMRRRFQELLDDAFSLFGSRSGSPEPQDSPTRQPHHDFRAKSAALVRPVSELLGTETILARPKTSASAISQRPSTAGNRSPKGAWSSSSLVAPGTPSLRPPPRPLSAGPFHRPSLEPSHILSDANLSPSDPAVPLIAAIQEELDKFAPPLPGSPPGPYKL